VLTEKPMANSPEECQQMIDAGKKAGKKLMVAYRCRYEPYNQEAIRLARSKELGAVKVITTDNGWNAGDPTMWRLNKKMAGGGCMMDIGIYGLQSARYISGEEPIEINALTYSTPGDPRFKEVEETINFQLRFPSGVLANCTSSYGYASQSHTRVICTDGWYEMDPATLYRDLRLTVHCRNLSEEVAISAKDHFALEMDHMSDCVMQNKEPLTPGEEGLRDLKLITAIYEAARTNKTLKV
jgi:predicted dehydrogenase